VASLIDLADGVDSLRNLTLQYLSEVGRTDRADKKFGIYFVSSHSEFAPLARFVERQVFGRVFGNDQATMDREYDPYEDASFFVLVVDHRRIEPAGVLRAIRPSSAGHKTIRDLAAVPEWSVTFRELSDYHGGVDADDVWDLATLAVRDQWTEGASGSHVSAALYHGIYIASLMAGVDHWVCMLDEAVADLVRAAEVPLRRICDLPAMEYLGSPATAPYIVHLAECAIVAVSAGELGRMLAFGEGLAEEFSLPPIDLRGDGRVDPLTLESQGELVGTGASASSGEPEDQEITTPQTNPP
jgi:hypothetical protein